MCTGIVENTKISGHGKGPQGWFPLEQASVSYDHPDHTPSERAVIIDLLSNSAGPESRVAVELTPQSARDLVHAILASLSRGEGERGEQGTSEIIDHSKRYLLKETVSGSSD